MVRRQRDPDVCKTHPLTPAIDWTVILVLSACPAFFTGCARPPADRQETAALYQSPAPPSVPAIFSPAYLVREPSQEFNKIGTPRAREVPGKDPELFVDPGKPSIYYETQDFLTPKGRYTNLIYRIHSQEVPLGWGKILERLLMSWWALDLYVGEDKAYSIHDKSGAVFYTSLKFWARQASDMKNFPEFLKYWGWNL